MFIRCVCFLNCYVLLGKRKAIKALFNISCSRYQKKKNPETFTMPLDFFCKRHIPKRASRQTAALISLDMFALWSISK